MLEITNLTKTYKGTKKPAVNNISLSLKPGEIFGFLGLNGAGKSTTFKCATGIQTFEEGTILINGFDIEKDPLNAKQSLGYIPDNHATFEELTGLEYINFMADVYKVSEELRKIRINRFAEMFNMEHALNTVIKAYSHGMKQKIAIMGGIIHYPKLWILDEPLVGLDTFSMDEIMAFMKEYAKDGNTIIFSSHIMALVKELCERVAIIDHGEIKALFEKPEDIAIIDKHFKEIVDRYGNNVNKESLQKK
ncbi:ABC transporter ATP-binding protein [Acholeplasma laidlawii]|uniref:ABC transporter ATP-binding protein n=1 Tax=Acholeplasma laidlawii TaxID=2148 RepID=UPI0018C2E509|nr:ABC transporter ATP-binding protein [Acholeplasma laidlawii]MBG0763009.1 ABC transporter ATP-binding protein [Acholeplasma laidlawii]